jgi:hypothetical protein
MGEEGEVVKCAAFLIAVTMLVGCPHKKQKPSAQMFVTKDCVVGFVKASKCEALTGELALCHDVVMKIACVKVIK